MSFPDADLENHFSVALPRDDDQFLSAEKSEDQILACVSRHLESRRLPSSTYRVQFNSGCTFRELQQVVPYLFTLGISDLYASPFLQARPGSPHGYDIVDPSAVNVEIGTMDELRALRAALREHHMGLIADVVPNHMAASSQLNVWWQDVLENGPSSVYASYFDIDWFPPKPDLAHKVLLPILGEQFGKVLEDGQLIVRYREGAFWLEYFEHQFPLAPASYALILGPRHEMLRETLGEEHHDMQELLSILTALKNLPARTETDDERLKERRREKEVVKRRLHELVQRSPEIAEFVQQNVRWINGRPGDPRSFDRLDELLANQAYRLSYWRVAADEINYRRFFDINELAAICTESPQVFADTHCLLLNLIDDGTISGLRIDHPDGLYDPRGYLCQLQEHYFLNLCRREWERAGTRGNYAARAGTSAGLRAESVARADIGPAREPDEEVWQPLAQRFREMWRATSVIPGSPFSRPLYLIVEKILAPGETLPSDWPVQGTVGYEFLNTVNNLLVDPRGEQPLSKIYERFIGAKLDFEDLAYQCKRLIVRMSMSSELSVLGHRLDRISEQNRWTRDFTLASLTRALQEVIACFRVYRTYVEPDRLLERDRLYIEEAAAEAKRRFPAMSASIFDFVRDMLLLRYHENADEQERRAVQNFAGKFQQLTGPITAKAVEDTAFYRYNRLVSGNEVGGDPAAFSVSAAQFHEFNRSQLPRLSHSLNATSTHDTKRSEDVRARINVLSEIPQVWRKHVQRWSKWNRRFKTVLDGVESPSRNGEYLLYQTLVGTWPDAIPQQRERTEYVRRIKEYMLKVVREAKVHTSWISPYEAYEDALARFVDGILADEPQSRFLTDLDAFAGLVAEHGRWNSLSQLLWKIASPGVPDLYQGTELWTLTLVDPDNRRPVDFGRLRRTLNGLIGEMSNALSWPAAEGTLEHWIAPSSGGQEPSADVAAFLQRLLAERIDGRIKMFLTAVGLRIRRLSPDLFSEGAYQPLRTSGKFAEHLVAFARQAGSTFAIALAPRWTASLTGLGGLPPVGDVWCQTELELPSELAGRQLFNPLTRETILLGRSREDCVVPVARLLGSFPVGLFLSPGDAPGD